MLSMRGSAKTSEDTEHIAFADWLNAQGLFWIHVPNEGKRHPATGAKLKRMGLRKGAPDFLIFDTPPSRHGRTNFRGIAIEMKRATGPAKPTSEQVQFLKDLEDRWWITRVCYGFEDAVRFMLSLWQPTTTQGGQRGL